MDELQLTPQPTWIIQLADHISEHLADGLVEPLAVLKALHVRGIPSYRNLTLELVARQMRLLLGDTTALARQHVKARSSALMLEAMRDGEPKDKINILAKWGPEPNSDASSGGLTVVVGAGSQVQINIGGPSTPQPVVVEASLTKSE